MADGSSAADSKKMSDLLTVEGSVGVPRTKGTSLKGIEAPVDFSRGPRVAAKQMLESAMFFHHLRRALSCAGLEGEEKMGVALYFAFSSRFRTNPLKVVLHEATEGSAKYAVKAVATLLEPGTLCQVFNDRGWCRFRENPDRKIAFLSDWSSDANGGMKARCDGNTLVRLQQRRLGGRVVEEADSVSGRFVCVSPERDRSAATPGRWLTIRMPEPPSKPSAYTDHLDEDRAAAWIEVQRLLEARAKLQIVLPDWEGVFFDHCCSNEFTFVNVPAFIEAWKTMALLRSFQDKARWETAKAAGVYIADFADLAQTGALLGGIFREGRTFPSLQKIYAAVYPNGQEFYAMNPLTGKDRKYLTLPSQKAKTGDFFNEKGKFIL